MENQNRRCSPDRRLSECSRGQSTAVLQQQHVDRLHRHTIRTTSDSAGMAHANGPAARCHFSTCPFIFSQLQRSVCTNGTYSLLPQRRLIKTSYVYYVPVVLLLLLPLFLFLYLCFCSRVPHTTISPFLYLPFYFFAATTKWLYKRHSFPISLLARLIFRFVTTGLILGTPLLLLLFSSH